MDAAEIERTVTSAIRAHLPAGEPDDPSFLDRTLNDLGLASMVRVELILEIEAEVGTTFPDDKLTEEHFGTPRAIIATVTALCGEPTSTPR